MLWQEALKEHGYEPPLLDRRARWKLRTYSRTWRRLYRLLSINPATTFFEVGCGGGSQLVPLALHGHRVAGIDVSTDVLERCRAHARTVEAYAGRELSIELYRGDFLDFSHDATYDVVFNFGVIEHFLDDEERLLALRKMLLLARPGGHVVSVVPSGMHPLRQRQRAEGLGGYDIPEIDYTDALAREEMIRAGALNPRVHPANLFGHLLLPGGGRRSRRAVRKLAWYCAQLIPPVPSHWTFRNAGTLIIIGQRA